MTVDIHLPFVIADQGLDGCLGVLRAKGTDDEVSLHVDGLAS
jgi:hypothetical protein